MVDELLIKILGADLEAKINVSSKTLGLVICANDSELNVGVLNQIAANFNNIDLATVVCNLYSDEERSTHIDNVELYTDRLVGVTKWCLENDHFKKHMLAYLGIDGASAPVISASAYWGGAKIKSVVTINGRPDLAGDVLDLVESPTLLIVGGGDKDVVDKSRQAYIHLGCEKKTEILVGVGSDLVNEQNVLTKVSDLSSKWILKHL
jgi:putative phosphoribosyl transferase